MGRQAACAPWDFALVLAVRFHEEEKTDQRKVDDHGTSRAGPTSIMNPPQLASSVIAQDRQRMLPPGPVLRACASILGLQRPGQLEVIAPTESWGLIPPLSLVTGATLCAASLANSPVLDNSAVSQLLFWGTTSFWLLLTICRL